MLFQLFQILNNAFILQDVVVEEAVELPEFDDNLGKSSSFLHYYAFSVQFYILLWVQF